MATRQFAGRQFDGAQFAALQFRSFDIVIPEPVPPPPPQGGGGANIGGYNFSNRAAEFRASRRIRDKKDLADITIILTILGLIK